MKSKKSLWLTTAVVVALGLATGVTLGDRMIHQPVEYTEAAWKNVFDTPAALARSTDVVVLAQVLDVAPGRVAVSDKGEGPLPFQLVTLEVIEGLRGATAGEHITVERAGGVDPTGRVVHVDIDGGELERGRVYLLFLERQEGTGLYYQINHQGRYLLKGDHFLAAAPDDPVATQLHGASLAEGLQRVQAALGAERPMPRREK